MGVLHKFRGNPASKDPFLEDFFRDMSPALARSFTDEQLRVIKMQFAARERGAHSVDLRFSVPLLRRYVVLLIGRERRTLRRRKKDRKNYPLATVGNLAVAIVVLVLIAIPISMGVLGFSLTTGVDPVEAVSPGLIESIREQLVLLIKAI
ncbi:MAG: hypothetical protein HOK98_04950 [Rhodospirillaceae bacterium]|jgi:hypothetical protein|nr:hypothetical protein [Rhodospirillaceae bacterium]MBT5943823.1 hypothetical protein [Rhodospirillaceae bacterium]MBT6405183.1 hypothetical protein [Rhodospirillaceae bacterium]MBT6535511.1 hypothetical protein [Rhodospirillaceae bacterium]